MWLDTLSYTSVHKAGFQLEHRSLVVTEY